MSEKKHNEDAKVIQINELIKEVKSNGKNGEVDINKLIDYLKDGGTVSKDNKNYNVCYIGMSENLEIRIKQHFGTERKDCDKGDKGDKDKKYKEERNSILRKKLCIICKKCFDEGYDYHKIIEESLFIYIQVNNLCCSEVLENYLILKLCPFLNFVNTRSKGKLKYQFTLSNLECYNEMFKKVFADDVCKLIDIGYVNQKDLSNLKAKPGVYIMLVEKEFLEKLHEKLGDSKNKIESQIDCKKEISEIEICIQ